MTPIEVVFISVLLCSLALNWILGKSTISLLGDLMDARQEMWQMHLERLPPKWRAAICHTGPGMILSIQGKWPNSHVQGPA